MIPKEQWCIRKASVRIRAEEAGQSLLAFLSRRFTYHDRSRWESLIGVGKVLKNGFRATAAELVTVADTVSYVGFEETEPAVRLDYGVVYEDEALLVVDKPGNLPCHPGGRYFTQTLWHALSAERGGHPCHFVNRIDRETSGLVLIAKTAEVAAACARQFAAGTVDKGYLAAVYGDFPEEPMCADGVLRPDDKSPVRKKQRFIPTGFSGVSAGGSAGAVEGPGSRCRTDFRLRKRAGGLSLVSATPMTGRLHQIRVSLLSLGYPVVGDKIYGPDDTLFIRFIEERLSEADRQALVLPRQALHAAYLTIRHPLSGQKVAWTAPLPADIAGLFGAPMPSAEKRKRSTAHASAVIYSGASGV